MSKYTVSQLLADLGELQVGAHYKYVKLQGGNVPANECIFQGVNAQARTISYSRASTPNVVDVISAGTFDVVVGALLVGQPCNLDVVLQGGGNNRSIFEALLANTRHVFACSKNRRKHIILLPKRDHPVGEISVLTDSELSAAIGDVDQSTVDTPWQLISYGAPGTGKSRGVNDVASKLPKENVVRTTFHPDSDYSTFVGAYKPKMESVPRMRIDGDEIKKITKGEVSLLTEKRISYEFVPQAFAKAYVQAWKKMAAPDTDGKVAPVMLVVEEINRGDCAKIFGDLFQLLDRLEKDDENDPKKKAGFSEYPVLADNDFADYVRRELEAVKGAAVFADYPSVIAAENLELMLPPNMYIWATMNTSDQSLFPMDSAFKRRWDWKYVPIKDHPEENWKIVIGTDEYSWGDFLKKINKEVRQLTSSEDKQLGYFFVKTPNKTVSEDAFVNKVLFFLWNVVWKDCYTECECLKNGDEYFTFRDFFDDEGKADAGNVNKVLAALKIEKWTAAVPTQSAVAAPGESANETSESATESETSATAE